MNALAKDFRPEASQGRLALAGEMPAPRLGPQPLVRTGRLTLRRPVRTDADAIAAALGDYRVARMLMRVPQPYHAEDAEDWLATIAADTDRIWAFAVTLTGVRAILAPAADPDNAGRDDRLAGVVTIEWHKSEGREGWHIGYWLAPEHWGRGIMSEAGPVLRDAYGRCPACFGHGRECRFAQAAGPPRLRHHRCR